MQKRTDRKTNTQKNKQTDRQTNSWGETKLAFSQKCVWGEGGDTLQNTSLAAPWSLTHRLQRRTDWKIQNGRQGGQKWPTESGKGSTPIGRSEQLS